MNNLQLLQSLGNANYNTIISKLIWRIGQTTYPASNYISNIVEHFELKE